MTPAHRLFRVPFLVLCLPLACTSDGGDSDSAGLPDDTQPAGGSDSAGWFPVDTGPDTGFNETPEHVLTLEHRGEWELTPIGGGPWTAFTGELQVDEYLDYFEDQPWCTARFALTGQATEDLNNCPACDVVFDVLFYLTDEGLEDDEGDPYLDENGNIIAGLGVCGSPDLPEHDEVRRMGLSLDAETIYFDYYGSDIWVPWYDIEQLHDDVDFEWTADVGFVVPDDN